VCIKLPVQFSFLILKGFNLVLEQKELCELIFFLCRWVLQEQYSDQSSETGILKAHIVDMVEVYQLYPFPSEQDAVILAEICVVEPDLLHLEAGVDQSFD
jgi:hypothetical protein